MYLITVDDKGRGNTPESPWTAALYLVDEGNPTATTTDDPLGLAQGKTPHDAVRELVATGAAWVAEWDLWG